MHILLIGVEYYVSLLGCPSLSMQNILKQTHNKMSQMKHVTYVNTCDHSNDITMVKQHF